MRKFIATAALAAAIASPALATSVTDGHIKLSFIQDGSTVTGSIIDVTGEIIKGDSDSFDRLINRANGPVIVVLDSPGGGLMEGLAIGETIKNRKFMTVANGTCASACAYIWLAGDSRGINHGSKVIFHSPYAVTDATHADGTAGVVVGQYLAEIGVDMKTSILITGHGPDDYYVLSAGAEDPLIPFTTLAEDSHSSPQQATQQPAKQASSIIVGMTCQPIGGRPYYVAYNNDAHTIGVTGLLSGKTMPYPVLEVENNQKKHVLYVRAKRGDQDRTMYFAFDYSRKGRDVSDIRVVSPNSDAKDSCVMDTK